MTTTKHEIWCPAVNIFPALFLAAALVVPVFAAQGFDHRHGTYEAILKEHVAAGLVDYRALKADPLALNRYLADLAAVSEQEFRTWSRPQRLSFLFNLYNAATLKLIVDHYPVKSIQDIRSWLRGPWDQKVVRLFGDRISLNMLEHGILRKEYDEPRLHLALVCAAKSCPPLLREAYVAETLDGQLDERSRNFLASPAGMKIDQVARKVHFSALFKWYGDDFVGKYTPRTGFPGLNRTERAVANFCARYVSPEMREFLEAGGYDVGYLDYDWSLNERGAR
jgi:hypothetical protein